MAKQPGATTKDIAFLLDKEKVAILPNWLKGLSTEERTWARVLVHTRYSNRVKKMISECRPKS